MTKRFFLPMLILGVSAAQAASPMLSGLTQQDCRSIFPGANSTEMIRTLASGVQYTEAWEHGSWGPPEELLGYVFLKALQYEGKTLEVLVGMKNTGVISKVCVRGMAGITDEFLAQYRGKTSRDNFDLARTPEDELVVPARMKAMQGDLALSESIAHGVKEIVMSASKLVK